jgi:hypothetical protein
VVDEAGPHTMSSCVCSQLSSDRAVPQDELGGGDASSESQQPCEALRGLSSLSIHWGMESFIVVTECEPGRAMDVGLIRDRPEEADGLEVPLNASESQARPPLSSRKLSLQERSQGGLVAGSSPDTNGRCTYPSLSYSPASSPQSSPRLPRRPTVESHHVSITGMQVRYVSEQSGNQGLCAAVDRGSPGNTSEGWRESLQKGRKWAPGALSSLHRAASEASSDSPGIPECLYSTCHLSLVRTCMCAQGQGKTPATNHRAGAQHSGRAHVQRA